MFTGFTNTPSSLFQIHREKIVGERDNFPWLFFFSDNRNILKSWSCKQAISAVALRTSLAKGKCLFRGLEIYYSITVTRNFNNLRAPTD